MDRRGFLKVTLGVAGAAAALAALPAEAMTRMAPMPGATPNAGEAPAAAIATPDDLADAKVESVYWRRRWGWRRRHWGWRRRHWGWRRHYWHRRRWWY
jgi:hypothetical protein